MPKLLALIPIMLLCLIHSSPGQASPPATATATFAVS